jgi:hypothetical protein
MKTAFSSRAIVDGLDRTSGSGEATGTTLKSLASYNSAPFEGMPASFETTAAGNGRPRKNEGTVEFCHRVRVAALPARTLYPKPENQARDPDRRRSARLQLARIFSGGGLQRALPLNDQIDLRFTTMQGETAVETFPGTATCCHPLPLSLLEWMDRGRLSPYNRHPVRNRLPANA